MRGSPAEDIGLGSARYSQEVPLHVGRCDLGCLSTIPGCIDNWHDHMLCGGVRPYLLPDDDYITREEIEGAARRWASGHDEAYEQYLRDHNEYLERERQFDEE